MQAYSVRVYGGACIVCCLCTVVRNVYGMFNRYKYSTIWDVMMCYRYKYTRRFRNIHFWHNFSSVFTIFPLPFHFVPRFVTLISPISPKSKTSNVTENQVQYAYCALNAIYAYIYIVYSKKIGVGIQRQVNKVNRSNLK